jgi:hypothetical protein
MIYYDELLLNQNHVIKLIIAPTVVTYLAQFKLVYSNANAKGVVGFIK